MSGPTVVLRTKTSDKQRGVSQFKKNKTKQFSLARCVFKSNRQPVGVCVCVHASLPVMISATVRRVSQYSQSTAAYITEVCVCVCVRFVT